MSVKTSMKARGSVGSVGVRAFRLEHQADCPDRRQATVAPVAVSCRVIVHAGNDFGERRWARSRCCRGGSTGRAGWESPPRRGPARADAVWTIGQSHQHVLRGCGSEEHRRAPPRQLCRRRRPGLGGKADWLFGPRNRDANRSIVGRWNASVSVQVSSALGLGDVAAPAQTGADRVLFPAAAIRSQRRVSQAGAPARLTVLRVIIPRKSTHRGRRRCGAGPPVSPYPAHF